MGWARASLPVPGLVPLKYFPPLEAATAADVAQAFEAGLRRPRQQPTSKGVWEQR